MAIDNLHIGQYVWWWTRKKGGYPKKVFGSIVQLSDDKQFARVRLEQTHPVPVQTIETKRLSESDNHD